MKKSGITVILFLVVILGLITGYAEFSKTESFDPDDYLRIHIRADSDSSADQSVKYSVKEAVTEYLTVFVAEADSKEKSLRVIGNNLREIERVADGVLSANGFSYRAKARLARENFPTRTYGDITLDAGEYDALIIDLGSGKGANWWCVVYPPLCFVQSGSSVVYKSKITEIINSFFSRGK
ncbi:MAG: stage II sporulation protein R [Clostridia bacterium]|nr:stage II sporulation protein R [Clostridia bacterium]